MGLASARVACTDDSESDDVPGHDHEMLISTSDGPRERAALSAAERRQQLVKALQEQREREVLELHTARSAHYVDNAFSLVTANMAVVSFVLGCVYMSRPCAKPLASFLLILGVLAPFAACLPILIRQWFYLHLRLRNAMTIGLLVMSALYVVWLLLGQRWAFACSSTNCDQDLSTATNAVVFVQYVMLLLYAAKIVWYLVLRARYSYRQLCLSCFQDPYPNALQLTDLELTQLTQCEHDELDDDDAAVATRRGLSTSTSMSSRKLTLLLDIQRHQRELRRSLHRLLQPTTAVPTAKTTSTTQESTKVTPLAETHKKTTRAASGGRCGSSIISISSRR